MADSKKEMEKKILIALSAALMLAFGAGAQPLRVAVAGVSHDHIWQMINIMDRGDFEVVGVTEADDALRDACVLHKSLSGEKFFSDVSDMLDAVNPEAVVCYGPPCDHLSVVEECAPRGISVMMEKPMATSYSDALKMQKYALKYGINVITNYCTTWYPAKQYAKSLLDSGKVGELFSMSFYGGHRGPSEIGCSKQFVDFLKDPERGGAGAIVDFGCYGANLATWMLGNARPECVYAVTQTRKPGTYAPVDDDSTIVLKYPGGITVTIFGSWDWPYTRLDSYIYGSEGCIYQKDDKNIQIQTDGPSPSEFMTAPALASPYDDSYRYLKAVVRGEVDMKPTDLSSIENNVISMEILDAAIRSTRKGKPIYLK